jgi:Protein of unknown function (DUF2975)
MERVGRQPRDRAYVGPGTTEVIATLLLVAGLVAAVAGLAYAINGATQAPGQVAVPVSLQVGGAGGAAGGAAGGEPVTVQVDGIELPSDTRLDAVDGGLALVDSTGAGRWTGFLARGDTAVAGLAFGLCAVLLAPVVRAVAAGEPFRRGNAARIGATAATILVGGMVAPLLPQAAGLAVLERLGLADAGSPFVVGVALDLAPVGLAALVFVVAEAFRRGAQLADDTAGLV